MEKEDIMTLAHLFSAMKDSLGKLESAMKAKDNENILRAKKEIINLQKEVDSLL